MIEMIWAAPKLITIIFKNGNRSQSIVYSQSFYVNGFIFCGILINLQVRTIKSNSLMILKSFESIINRMKRIPKSTNSSCFEYYLTISTKSSTNSPSLCFIDPNPMIISPRMQINPKKRTI